MIGLEVGEDHDAVVTLYQRIGFDQFARHRRVMVLSYKSLIMSTYNTSHVVNC